MNERLKRLIQESPKAELHYHIDSIPPELALRFAERNQIKMPFSTLDEAKAFYHFSNLEEFINTLVIPISAIHTEDDFCDMIIACAQDMENQNIIYREIMFDYSGCFAPNGVSLGTVMTGFAKGLEIIGKKYPRRDIRMIPNLDRTASPEDNLQVLAEIATYKEAMPIIAIGMDMQENGYPASIQKDVYAKAKELGFFVTGHAGEDDGAESIWNSIHSMNPDRIDHGVRAVEDATLMDHLKEKQLLLTLCPDSNVMLGVYPAWESFPLREFISRDIPVCLNSDDPPCFQYDLTGNLLKAAETFNLSETEIVQLIRAPFIHNFAGQEYLREVDTWLSDFRNNKR
ncbi:MAG: adenosine deaminase [Oscillibacter sp.]|nr:adenosine deaminase [Oscillibacter sp.]